jgi:hypothetical protein
MFSRTIPSYVVNFLKNPSIRTSSDIYLCHVSLRYAVLLQCVDSISKTDTYLIRPEMPRSELACRICMYRRWDQCLRFFATSTQPQHWRYWPHHAETTDCELGCAQCAGFAVAITPVILRPQYLVQIQQVRSTASTQTKTARSPSITGRFALRLP